MMMIIMIILDSYDNDNDSDNDIVNKEAKQCKNNACEIYTRKVKEMYFFKLRKRNLMIHRLFVNQT